MKRRIVAFTLVAVMAATSALAERFILRSVELPEGSEQQARAAVAVYRPEASIDYTLLDFDDGDCEWNVFFSCDDRIAMATVDAKTGELMRVVEYAHLPQGALNAAQAIAALGERAGGEMTVLELDIDSEDRERVYEGEVEIDGRIYEFTMTLDGRIIEWERD